MDLLFYLFGVADGAVRQKEWLYLLRFYYERFEEYAAQLGQDKIFNYQVSYETLICKLANSIVNLFSVQKKLYIIYGLGARRRFPEEKLNRIYIRNAPNIWARGPRPSWRYWE